MRNRYACNCLRCRRRNAEAERALFSSIFTIKEVQAISQGIVRDFSQRRVLEFTTAGDDD